MRVHTSSETMGRPAPAFLPRIGPDLSGDGQPIGISDMAELFGVTHRTLHFYEEKGLISAERLGMMRVYDHRMIRKMAVINACREIGMPLSAIQDLMQDLSEAASQLEADAIFCRVLDSRKRELTSDISSIHRQIQQIRTLVNEIDITPTVTAGVHVEPLTFCERDRRCLVLMTEGFKGADLARQLNMTEEELAALEESLIVRLGVSNRFQAAAKAIVLGLLPH
ncbi:DNA-binding transcriptional MerR regulator [Neorhizobium galegae]|uniref:MerR family transcriptional regulator n=1 Tax=Neorhizobium galegae TaxID=399 RepID=UPI001AE11050|nr:MerR family transcriptional regulator [Neorhizobium galegae]MBP2549172.1 DNA-binding transcriptional MerR regulator [Neorhizobium galegae]